MNEIELPAAERDAFFQAVWMIVRQIPRGQVSTYGQVADYIPAPAGAAPEAYKAFRARWVGYAMAACPPDVPWQRVINAQGKISVRRGAEEQRRLLEAEGVLFDARERVDLKQYGWAGPSPDWLRANRLVAPDEPQQPSLF
jgi:methylated-DNA-protein-cysteine methyltransferase-like protein